MVVNSSESCQYPDYIPVGSRESVAACYDYWTDKQEIRSSKMLRGILLTMYIAAMEQIAVVVKASTIIQAMVKTGDSTQQFLSLSFSKRKTHSTFSRSPSSLNPTIDLFNTSGAFFKNRQPQFTSAWSRQYLSFSGSPIAC
jgi:hypothetical protein